MRSKHDSLCHFLKFIWEIRDRLYSVLASAMYLSLAFSNIFLSIIAFQLGAHVKPNEDQKFRVLTVNQ